MTATLAQPHATFLDHLIAKLKQDARFEALLAGGSMIHGGFDEYSDLDLIPVVKANAFAQVMAERREIAAGFGELLSAFTGEHVGEPRLLICLYGPGLLHVDLKFVVLSDLEHTVERPQVLWARDETQVSDTLDRAVVNWPNRPAEWFEQRAWIWLHYGASKLQRGELFEAMNLLAFFREQVLGPMLHRRARRPQRGVRKIELDSAAAQALETVVAAYDKKSISTALLNAAQLYLELREDERPAVLTAGMPELLLPMLAMDPHQA